MMTLTYRLCREDDVAKIEKLWRTSTDWGVFTPEMFRRHCESAPFGTPMVVVAEDTETGEILGQAVLMRSRVIIKGKEVAAFRPIAPILAPALRGASLNPMQHPIVRLYQYGYEQLRTRGESLAFMLPDPRWTLLLRMAPRCFNTKFPLWSIPVPLTRPFELKPDYSSGPIREWDRRVDKIFGIASQQFHCMVVRDAESLRKKAGPPDYDVLAVERGSDLVGIASSRLRGDRQWLICDLLAADHEAQIATLQAVCNLAHSRAVERSSDKPIIKAAILALPAMQPALHELGFSRDRYDFHLAVTVLDDSMCAADVDPSGWYISAND
jgi:hypothetical protein